MSKKKEKRNAAEKELERHLKIYSRSPFLRTEPLQEYCDKIKEEAYEDCDDFSYINFKEREQYLPSGSHQFIEAVVMISPLYADHSWFQSGDENAPDAEIYTGKINDPVTEIPQTRAFLRRMIEEIGEYHISELESFYTVALAYYNFETPTHNGEMYNTTLTYALITFFISGKMFELDFYEVPSIAIIKKFISDISAALKANPKNRCCDMPKKEMFMDLMEKLTIVHKSAPIPTVSENNAVGSVKVSREHYKRFDKELKIKTVKRIKAKQLTEAQAAKELGTHISDVYKWVREYERRGEKAFPGRGRESLKNMKTGTPNQSIYDRRLKMAAVKLVKENNQPISQVEKNLGIGEGNLRQWIRQYEKYGENAFRGSGSFSPNPDKRKLIEEIFKDEIAEAAAPPPTPCTDVNKYNILNLPHDKENMLEVCAYKLRKYDKAFKIKTVERIKKYQLPVVQVSEKLGIEVSLLRDWVAAYEKYSENAFPGSGPKSHNNDAPSPSMDNDRFRKSLEDVLKVKTALRSSNGADDEKIIGTKAIVCDDAPAQNDTAEAISLSLDSDTVTDSTNDNDATKKKVAAVSNKKPVYDKEYKMAAVKYVNENNLSAYQVAEKLNIPYLSLNRWIRLYEEHGENAFSGPGVYYET